MCDAREAEEGIPRRVHAKTWNVFRRVTAKGGGRRGEVEALLALDASRGWTLHLREAKEDKQKFHRRRCRECPL